MTAAETPDLALNTALFVGALDPGDRELRLVEIVGAQRAMNLSDSTRRRPRSTCLTALARLS